MKRFRKGEGFTAIEMVVSVGIIVVITVIVVSSLFSERRQVDLENTTRQIAASLREAQSRSAAGEGGVTWGVHFENTTNTQPFFALFKNVYGTSTRSSFHVLPRAIGFSTSTVALGSSTEAVFGKVSGFPAASFRVGIFLLSEPRKSSTINVATSGMVSH